MTGAPGVITYGPLLELGVKIDRNYFTWNFIYGSKNHSDYYVDYIFGGAHMCYQYEMFYLGNYTKFIPGLFIGLWQSNDFSYKDAYSNYFYGISGRFSVGRSRIADSVRYSLLIGTAVAHQLGVSLVGLL